MTNNLFGSWIISEAKKDDVDSDIAKYDGKWKVESAKENALDGDLALVLKSKARCGDASFLNGILCSCLHILYYL